ncbi:MAG: nucleotidyltransferase domain-containing protein [Promethearchaeota archaeon]
MEIKQRINEFLADLKESKYFSLIDFIFQYGSSMDNYVLEDCDIDICIYIEESKKKLEEIRLNLLKKFNDKFDIQIFQILPLYVQVEVLKGKLLYFKDLNKVYSVAYKTIEEYEDFYPLYYDYINRNIKKCR